MKREVESVNRKGVFGLVFLLRESCCYRGELVFRETVRVLVRENGHTLPCLVKNIWNITHKKLLWLCKLHLLKNVRMCLFCDCARMLLTAARLVVEARGHEEALLGCGGRQSPLVRRKDGNHQRRELALDLLMREGGEGRGWGGARGWWAWKPAREGGRLDGGREEEERERGRKHEHWSQKRLETYNTLSYIWMT